MNQMGQSSGYIGWPPELTPEQKSELKAREESDRKAMREMQVSQLAADLLKTYQNTLTEKSMPTIEEAEHFVALARTIYP